MIEFPPTQVWGTVTEGMRNIFLIQYGYINKAMLAIFTQATEALGPLVDRVVSIDVGVFGPDLYFREEVLLFIFVIPNEVGGFNTATLICNAAPFRVPDIGGEG